MNNHRLQKIPGRVCRQTFLPKKKREVDLKWKPSKTRIAAEKYSRSKFFTKPTHLPRPVRRRKAKTDSSVALGSMEGQMKDVNIATDSETTTVPATSRLIIAW